MQSPHSSLTASLLIAAPLGALVACLAALASCGAGTAAAVSGGGGGSGGNAPPSMSGFTVLDPKLPAGARVRFVLSDAEGNPATVELFYQAPGQPVQQVTQAGSNPAVFATSSQGVEHELPWNFADESELPDDAHFVDDVQVFASIAGGIQQIVLGANGASIGLGNDAPVVSQVEPPVDEVPGIVLVRLLVSDTSSDVVSIKVEYDIVGDLPDSGWKLARPAQESSTPEFGIRDVVASRDATSLAFFWDTNVDLADLERDVRLRFTPEDSVVTGTSAVSPAFRVDNNAEPIATVSGDLLLINPDQRAGIPIPYTVRDEESDEVQVVFQWRRPNEDFPPLPDTPAEINVILADPALRTELHICTQYPTWVEGRVVPIDSNSVRFPELATSASSVLARGLIGRDLGILRASNVPKPIAETWASNALDHPAAALPVSDGIEALVLDRASSGAWRLRQIYLATGVVTRALVSASPGEPSAMAFERDELSVLIASNIGGAWQLTRVKLADGAITPLIAFDGTTEAGAIRGLASQGAGSALVTVASSLIRLDYAEPQSPRAVTLFDDLATPWGVVADPLNTNRIYVAERDAETDFGTGRLLSIGLDTRERHAIPERPIAILEDVFEPVVFDHPRALTIDRSGARLLVITQSNPSDGTRGLQAIDLGKGGQNRSFQLATGLPEDSASIATGRDGLLIVALTSEDDLAVGGGIEQQRTIDGLELAQRTVHVSSSFAPALSASQRCRVSEPALVLRPSPTGTRGLFVWDSEDLPEGGSVKLRAVPMDAERGVEGASEASKVLRPALGTEPVTLGNESVTNSPQSVAAADLDGDGDLDLATANVNSNTITVFFQEGPGVFGSIPLSLGNESVTNGPMSVTAADLDGDGDLDLASANHGGNTLTVFFQESPGVFGTTPLSLGNESVTSDPRFVTAADIDGDGDLDLASANFVGNTLTVFFQESPGVFGSTPLSLGNESVTYTPWSVAAADLDGDGDLDLTSANYFGSSLTVFFQESPGVFSSTPVSLGNKNVTSGASSVAAADLDGDGDLDLASANVGSNTLTVFFQESVGVFGPTPLSLENASMTNGPYSVTAADIDGDGDLDLATANGGGSSLTVFFQESPGVFGSTPLSLGNESLTNFPIAVTAADLDGDGQLDLASTNAFGNTLTVFFQRSRGVFSPTPLTIGNVSLTNVPESITAADLDGDGDLDLASANLVSNTLAVFFQESPGVFSSTPLALGNASVTERPLYVTAGDLDGDGDLDLVSANEASHTLTIFFQTNPGVFASTPISLGNTSLTNAPVFVTAADLDGDGDLDLASANLVSNTLTVFFQESPGNFGSTPLSLGNAGVTNAPLSVTAADLDGDGDLDLASANLVSNTLTVFFQESPGVFDTTPLSLGNASLTLNPQSVTAADIDGDGDLDLVSANPGSVTLTVFFQESPGVFGTHPLSLGSIDVFNRPISVVAADVDGDGDLDLASANENSQTLTVFFQESPGVFGATPMSLGNASVTNGPHSVAAADLDGDGDIDLASANVNSSTLTIFWNNH